MNTSEIFREMPLTTLITNFSAEGGFERIYLATNRKPNPAASNQFRKRPENGESKNSWNGRQLTLKC
jgi:hypothetical protein